MSEHAMRLLKLDEVLAKTRMSRSWIYAAIKSGAFPSPLRLSVRSIAWLATDVEQWLEERPRAGINS